MEQPPNADDQTRPTSLRRTPESRDETGVSKQRATWRGPGGIRVSVIGIVGVVLVVVGILTLVLTGNAPFGSGVVVVGFGVLLIDALRAR